jgi:hypothetical protein
VKNVNLALRLLLSILSIGAVACSQSNNAGTSTGGATSSAASSGGRSSGLGGAGDTASGGASGNGGTKASGGAQGTGGVALGTGGNGTAGSGGTSLTGGSTGSGGALGTGGITTVRTGGTSGSGAGGVGSGGRDSGGAGGTTTGSNDASAGGSNGTGGSTGSDGGTGATTATIVPDSSWTCGMPDGIPAPTLGTLAFSVSLTVSAIHDVGNTQFGKRRQLDVSGGTITGDKLKGTVLTGGLDYELTLSTGAMELEEVLIWKTSDGTTIFTRVCGVAAPGDSLIRIVPDIEAPTSGSYAWLNTTKLVGTRTVDSAGSKITLDVYDVSKVTAGDPKVQLKDPSGVPNVSWDCVTATGTNGASVFTENVTLGSTVSVSNAKRGSRNIIPITGGTTTGSKESGKILNGGADYQLAATGGSTTLDARYTLQSSDGYFIIVRNCGPMSGLTPVFEADSNGPYAFLTTGKFLSSAPGSGSGGVSITFYERK